MCGSRRGPFSHVLCSPVVGVILVKRLVKLHDLMRSRETSSDSDQTVTQLRLLIGDIMWRVRMSCEGTRNINHQDDEAGRASIELYLSKYLI